MSVIWPGVLVALLIILFTFLYRRSYYFKNKLKWVPAPPAMPIIGCALEFMDSTTELLLAEKLRDEGEYFIFNQTIGLFLQKSHTSQRQFDWWKSYGNQFADYFQPIKIDLIESLDAVHKYVLKYDGLCFMELLLRPALLISDYRFTAWLLSSNSLLTKSRDYQYLNKWLEEGLLITGGDKWKKSRKILTPVFHFAILEQFVDVLQKPTSVLIEILNKEVQKESVDIHPYITKFTLDVICQTAMGVELSVQEDSHSDYVQAVDGMCRIVVERAFSLLKMIDFFYWFSLDYYRERKYIKVLHKVSNEVIKKKKEELEQKVAENEDNISTKKKMAFLDHLLLYRDENGEPLPEQFIRQEVDTFMFAGHDTTASALSFAIYCLANHPDVQVNALAEIREALGESNTINYKVLQELKYLDLVIKETLRLYPSVPYYSRQTTEDILYEEDKIIPKGVTLAIIAYTINRDPKVYDNPDEFIPTRFLDSDIKAFSYVPFSAGPRNCIGQKFAILEMKSTLAKLLLNFELLPAIPEHTVILAAETVLKSKNGIRIKLKKR